MNLPLHKRLLAEAFGTFWIVFAGTGAIVVNDLTGVITHIGIAVTFGLVVFAIVAALGDISGAHFNPAVTIGFYLAKRFPRNLILPYALSQCIGAVLASATLYFLFPCTKRWVQPPLPIRCCNHGFLSLSLVGADVCDLLVFRLARAKRG